MRTGTECPAEDAVPRVVRDGCDTGSRSTGHADAHPAGPVALAPGLHPSPVLERRRCARRVSLIGGDGTPRPALRVPVRVRHRGSRCVMVAIERLSSASLRLAIRVRGRAEATRERQKGCEGEQPLCARYHSRSRCLSFLIQYIHSETQAETLPEVDIQRRPLATGWPQSRGPRTAPAATRPLATFPMQTASRTMGSAASLTIA